VRVRGYNDDVPFRNVRTCRGLTAHFLGEINGNPTEVADDQRGLLLATSENNGTGLQGVLRPGGQALVVVPGHRKTLRRRDLLLGNSNVQRFVGAGGEGAPCEVKETRQKEDVPRLKGLKYRLS